MPQVRGEKKMKKMPRIPQLSAYAKALVGFLVKCGKLQMGKTTFA